MITIPPEPEMQEQEQEYTNMLDLLRRLTLKVRLGDSQPITAFYHHPDSIQQFHFVRLPSEPDNPKMNLQRVHVNQIQVQHQGNVL
jgi:hypothetical protein